MKIAYSILALGVLSACAAVPQSAGTDQIGPGYTTAGGTWSSGGGITTVSRIVERNGQTALCGAWTTDPQSALSTFFNEDVIQAGSAFLGDTRLTTGLGFMNRVTYSDNLTGTVANCVLTGVPWSAELAAAPLVLRFPRQSFGNTSGGGRIGGIGSADTVSFRQTARPDLVL